MNKPVNITTWSSDHVTWIDITDPTQAELKEYSKQYNLEYYSLADCLEPAHLPKKETMKDLLKALCKILVKLFHICIFLVVKYLSAIIGLLLQLD